MEKSNGTNSTNDLGNTSKVRSRNWCFTINNYNAEDLAKLQHSDYTYIGYGKEVGKNGTPHLQGFIHNKNAVGFVNIKKWLANAHIEKCIGNISQNIKYCSKDGDYTEVGDRPKMLSIDCRVRLCDSLRMNNYKIRECFPACAEKLIANRLAWKEKKGYNDRKLVFYITGESGSGKTLLAHQIVEGKIFDLISMMNGFMVGYEGSDYCIYDEFRDSDMPLKTFLLMTDKYRNRFNVKGSSIIFDPEILIITSIKHPSELYANIDESRKQINRRLIIFNL